MTTATNRQTIREQFAALLTTALVGTGLPVQAVYAYRVGDFEGKSPAVTVSSLGSRRPVLTMRGSKPSFRIQVDVFVLYASADGSWTEQNAEDTLDDIEEKIGEVISGSRNTDYWIGLDYDGPTQRVDVAIGGVDYIREVYTLEFK